MPQFHVIAQDGVPAEAEIVDIGLEEFNERAAPLHEVQTLSCLVHDGAGKVVGGAVGRRWGELCELQQLWVDESLRGSGVGERVVREFERHAVGKGCKSFYLETFSFQAPDFYRKLGYRVVYERTGYPHGIVKHHMLKAVGGAGAAL